MNKREITLKEFKTFLDDGISKKKLNIFDTPSVKLELLKYGIHNDRTEKDTYIIGDLNGSAIKLLQFLVSTGILKGSAANRAIYDKFEQWYSTYSNVWVRLDHEIHTSEGESGIDRWIEYKERISKEIKAVIKLLSGLRLDSERCSAVRLVFVGDTLADRGVSDTATLKIYDLLQKSGIDFTVVLSNHDIVVVQKYVLGGWSNPIHEDYKDSPVVIPEKGSYDCGAPVYDLTKSMFIESYLPKLDLIYLEPLRNENDYVQCAVSHAPIISDYLFGLEKNIFSNYYARLPSESKYLVSTIDTKDMTLPLIQRLNAACSNLQMMFRSLRDAYITKANQAIFKELIHSYNDHDGFLGKFVENRRTPTKIHDDWLNVYGHSFHAGEEYQIKDDSGKTIKKGIRFAPKREDRSEMDPHTMQPILAMVDVKQKMNNANNICLDNKSGRPGLEELPLLTARISTTDAKFTPKKKASPEIQSGLSARNNLFSVNAVVLDQFQNPHVDAFELEIARDAILEGILNYIGKTDRMRGVTATSAGKRVDGHGADGRRRAIELKVRIDKATDLNELYTALRDLVNGRINRDAAGRIRGSIQLNPDSLTTTIINSISRVPCFNVDFDIHNNRDDDGLRAIARLMGQPRAINRNALR